MLKSTVFWDITPCSPFNVNRRFGGTYRLQLQGRRIGRARYQCESRWQAEQSANRNFELYRKQGGKWKSGTQFWLARPQGRMKLPPPTGFHGRTNRRQEFAFTLVFCSAYLSTLQMETICSSETSIGSQ
jgi:hypothetical protein